MQISQGKLEGILTWVVAIGVGGIIAKNIFGKDKKFEELKAQEAAQKPKFICTSCGCVDRPNYVRRGNGALELILWLFFLVPGIIYSFWRSSNEEARCPKCQKSTMIPADSPIGQKILRENSPA